MSNVSGIQINKTFKTGIPPQEPYYYIHAHLDLTGAEVGVLGNNYVYYFNKENNYNYLNYIGGADKYPGFYPIEDNSVIDEVVVYSGPDLKYTYDGGDLSDLEFSIGGAYKPSLAEVSLNPLDVWGGESGNQPGAIQGNLLTDAQVCRYGREPAFPDAIDDDSSLSRKFLALNITRVQPVIILEPASVGAQQKSKLGEIKVANKVLKGKNGKPKFVRQVLPEDVIDSGSIHVVVKVLVKFQ